MTHYYLATYVQLEGGFAPSGFDAGDGNWGAIDLRPDVTVQAGRCLLGSDQQLPTSPGRFYLGDALDEPSAVLKSAIESRLGITLTDNKLRRIVRSLLVEHGDDKRQDRWNALKPGVDGRYRIYLVGLIDEFPVVQGGAVITDDFNRADSTTLTPSAEGWSWTETTTPIASNIDINANEAKAQNGSSAGSAAIARAESDLATTDHYAQANCFASGNAAAVSGVCVRFDASAVTFYGCFLDQNDVSHEIHKRVAGTRTQLAAVTTPTASGLLIRLEVNGSNLEMFAAGVSLITTTDTSITTGVRTGITGAAVGAANRAKWDNFEAGDLVVSAVFPSRRYPRGVESGVNRGVA